jgi:hypothetical protein
MNRTQTIPRIPDVGMIWIRLQHPGPPLITVERVLGPRFRASVTIGFNSEEPIICTECGRSAPTMEFVRDLLECRLIVCCEATFYE